MNVSFQIKTVSLALAVGQVLGDWIFNVSVINGDVSSLYQRIDSAGPSASLESVPPGSYSVTAQRFDVGGNAFGSQVSASFLVQEPEVTQPAPPLATGEPTVLGTGQVPALTTEGIAALAPAPIAMGDAADSIVVTLS